MGRTRARPPKRPGPRDSRDCSTRRLLGEQAGERVGVLRDPRVDGTLGIALVLVTGHEALERIVGLVAQLDARDELRGLGELGLEAVLAEEVQALRLAHRALRILEILQRE